MDNEKEKIEKELAFLKESFESEVITEEEYLSAKERMEKQLMGIESTEKSHTKKTLEENKTLQQPLQKKEQKDEIADIGKDVEIEKEAKEIDNIKEASHGSITQEAEEKHEHSNISLETSKDEQKANEQSVSQTTNYWKYFIFLMLAFLIFVIIAIPLMNKPTGNEKEKSDNLNLAVSLIVCKTDDDCINENIMGKCVNPSTNESKCEFPKSIKTELLVLSSKECFNCNPSRVIELLKGLYPGLIVHEIDFSSEESEKLISSYKIKSLPAFIFDSNLTLHDNFNKTKTAFLKRKNKYILSPEASGASYFLNREIIPKRLDIFLTDENSVKVEKNLEEFLKVFGDEINITKHNPEDNLTKDLDIKTFPKYLVNNKILFFGILPSEKVKENFCMLNNLTLCQNELSKSLII